MAATSALEAALLEQLRGVATGDGKAPVVIDAHSLFRQAVKRIDVTDQAVKKRVTKGGLNSPEKVMQIASSVIARLDEAEGVVPRDERPSIQLPLNVLEALEVEKERLLDSHLAELLKFLDRLQVPLYWNESIDDALLMGDRLCIGSAWRI